MTERARDQSREAVPPAGSAQFGYFVVQAKAEFQEGQTEVSGVLENLHTGERLPFGSPEELGRLVGEWGRLG